MREEMELFRAQVELAWEENGLLGLLSVVFFSAHALTRKQRSSIVEERDQGSCHTPFPHECNQNLYVVEPHHLPLRQVLTHFGVNVGKIPQIILSMCRNGHDEIHPDRVWAREHENQLNWVGINVFDEVQEWRKEMLNQGLPYWNNKFDRRIAEAARKRTARAEKRGWQYTNYLERYPPDEAVSIVEDIVYSYSSKEHVDFGSIGYLLTQFLVEKYGSAIRAILGNGNGSGKNGHS